jgi:hypothetical protein
MRNLGATLAGLLILAAWIVMVAGIFWWHWLFWSECRVDHGWFYCLYLMGK